MSKHVPAAIAPERPSAYYGHDVFWDNVRQVVDARIVRAPLDRHGDPLTFENAPLRIACNMT